MVEVNIEASREKVKSLLKELFQFDMQDLDFGIYRIMNFKRKEIERFIDEDLIAAAEAEFKEYAKSGIVDLQNEVDRLRAEIVRDFGQGTIDEQGKVLKNKDAPKIREYLDKVSELESTKLTQSQIEDVFNHIYEFFSRYYDKGDFLSKRRYGGREKYYVPYNGEEVLLHWANNDQYYVKTGEYFKKYSFKTGEYRINFVLKQADVEQNNIKVGPKYFILPENDFFELDEKKRELTVFFMWRELFDEEKEKYGTRDVQKTTVLDIADKLFSKIGDKGLGIELRKKPDGERTILEKNLSLYVERNTTDYFIHKNLKSFLERELDFYLKNEVLDLDEIEKMDEKYVRMNRAKIRAIGVISKKIIAFLAQIEDFQKMLFEKKKCVLRTDYCVTLDLVPETFLAEIGTNEAQVDEWKKLFKLKEYCENTFDQLGDSKTLNPEFLKKHRNLVLDTRWFPEDFKLRLLSSFDRIDEEIDGILIKGENFQALSLLLARYLGKIKCIYIDPPYNTGSDEFLYKDRYRHSSWLSMMADRLQLANRYMRGDGAIFVNINDIENSSLMALMRRVFGDELEMPTFIWKKKGTSTNVTGVQVSSLTDFVIAFGGSDSVSLRITPKEQRSYPYQDKEGRYRTTIIEKKHAGTYARETMTFEILGQKPRLGKRWQIGEETAKELEKKHRFVLDKGVIKLKIYDFEDRDTFSANPNLLIDHGSTDRASQLLKDMFGKPEVFSNPKPVELISHLVSISTSPEDSIILDFFAGSGTTAHAIINLNSLDGGKRKYILVEIGDCFDEIILPRIKKVVFSREWKDGTPTSKKGTSHMLKYLRLEDYEDALNNIVFKEKDRTIQQTLESFQDYFLRYMLDYETRESPTRLLMEKFQTPFDYKIKSN